MDKQDSALLEFKDNHLLMELVGSANHHLNLLEKKTHTQITLKGNQLLITGTPDKITLAKNILEAIYRRLEQGQKIDIEDIETEFRFNEDENNFVQPSAGILTKKKTISPRNPKQEEYIKALQTHDLVFGIGPAGTGKTYLAVAVGVSLLIEGKIDRIILSRPAVEAGEKLGFLPGDMREKIDPYLRPLYDALHDMMPQDQVNKRIANGEIEVAPLAFMRGRTLSNAFVILDEAQNTTPVQMKMFLTRLGNNARMVVTGDLSQIDLPNGILSGLKDALRTLMEIEDISFITFQDTDVVRHSLVSKIVRAYDLKRRLDFRSNEI